MKDEKPIRVKKGKGPIGPQWLRWLLFTAAASHNLHGLTLALWRDVFPQPKTPPEGHSESYMLKVLDRVDEILGAESAEKTAMPNILFILSESFYALDRLPVLQYGGDPLEHFHALEAEIVSGRFHSHYLGYGTGYIEMSMLHGLNSPDLPPETNICFQDDEIYELFDALAEQYTKSGDYSAEMLHAYDDTLYNRTVTYPMPGFNELYFSDDIQQMGIEREGGAYDGYYMRDGYFFQGMLERMNAVSQTGRRAFLYGTTMENHQPFDLKKFNYECQLSLVAEDFTRPSGISSGSCWRALHGWARPWGS